MNKIYFSMLITFASTLSTIAMDRNFPALAKMEILEQPFFDVWNALNLSGKDRNNALEKLGLFEKFNHELAILELIESIDSSYTDKFKYISAHGQLIRFIQESKLSDELLKRAEESNKYRRLNIIGKLKILTLGNITFEEAWSNANSSKLKESTLIYAMATLSEKVNNNEISPQDFNQLLTELDILKAETISLSNYVREAIDRIVTDLRKRLA